MFHRDEHYRRKQRVPRYLLHHLLRTAHRAHESPHIDLQASSSSTPLTMNALASSSHVSTNDKPQSRQQSSGLGGTASRFFVSMRKSISHTLLTSPRKRHADNLVSKHLYSFQPILIIILYSVACTLLQKNETLMSIHECPRDTETPQLPVLLLNKLQWVFMYPVHPIYEIRVITAILHLHHPLIYGTPATHPHRTVPHTASLRPLPALPSRKLASALL